jgi:hypothetical protein
VTQLGTFHWWFAPPVQSQICYTHVRSISTISFWSSKTW